MTFAGSFGLAPGALAAPAAQTAGQVGVAGHAASYGSPGGVDPAGTVGLARSATGHGYWVVGADGGVFSFGDATFHGSLAGTLLNQPIVGMAATPDGGGYWLVAADGGVFNFGDASFLGSTGAEALNQPIVGMAPTPTGRGYWLVARDGGVFSFGDATFFGSTGAETLNQPVVGMAATPTGGGYWLASRDGGIFSFGDATFQGSIISQHSATSQGPPGNTVSAIAAAPAGQGYWLADQGGSVYAFGTASYQGGVGPEPPGAALVGLAATPDGLGYWGVSGPLAPQPQTVAASAPATTPLGTFVITCYDLGGTTATGAPVGPGVVAVDPSVIPLGSRISIDGAGDWTALDTGGAIQGNRLDIWEPSGAACDEWGVQTRAVTLYR
ncbi:MAG: 3D domain-containing protein [Acidimicrobiales bacterium]